MLKPSATRDGSEPAAETELQRELQCESLADLTARQTLRVEQVVDVAADIAKEIALMHQQGLAYGVLDSRHIRISGGRGSLAPMEPAADRRTADDVRDFGVWLRGLVQALPQQSGDWRRIELDEISARYLQPEGLPVSRQMKKAAMALSLLRVTSHGTAAPEAALENVNAPAAPAKIPRKGKVLLLVRVVSRAERRGTADAKAPLRKAPWFAAAIVVACVVGVLLFMKGIL